MQIPVVQEGSKNAIFLKKASTADGMTIETVFWQPLRSKIQKNFNYMRNLIPRAFNPDAFYKGKLRDFNFPNNDRRLEAAVNHAHKDLGLGDDVLYSVRYDPRNRVVLGSVFLIPISLGLYMAQTYSGSQIGGALLNPIPTEEKLALAAFTATATFASYLGLSIYADWRTNKYIIRCLKQIKGGFVIGPLDR